MHPTRIKYLQHLETHYKKERRGKIEGERIKREENRKDIRKERYTERNSGRERK
jgi:hypothetical protein